MEIQDLNSTKLVSIFWILAWSEVMDRWNKTQDTSVSDSVVSHTKKMGQIKKWLSRSWRNLISVAFARSVNIVYVLSLWTCICSGCIPQHKKIKKWLIFENNSCQWSFSLVCCFYKASNCAENQWKHSSFSFCRTIDKLRLTNTETQAEKPGSGMRSILCCIFAHPWSPPMQMCSLPR